MTIISLVLHNLVEGFSAGEEERRIPGVAKAKIIYWKDSKAFLNSGHL